MVATGCEEEYEVKAEAPDGSMQWYRSVMKPIWTDGRVSALILIANNTSELRAAQEEAERLRGLLPICAWCGQIRGVDGVWQKLDSYVSRELSRRITHTQCPECAEKSMADLENNRSEP